MGLPRQKDLEGNSPLKYEVYDLAVCISVLARPKLDALNIMHAGFSRLFRDTLSSVQESIRTSPNLYNEQQVYQVELLAIEDVPEGIKISYFVRQDTIWIADVFTNLQHALFHVDSNKPKRKKKS